MKTLFRSPVVVGVDGSASSLSAVRLAAVHAASYGRPLHIIHAFNWLPRQPETADNRSRAIADDVLRCAVCTAREVDPGIVIRTRLMEGAAAPALLRQARTAALLAVGDGGLSSHVCLPTQTSAVQIAARAACSVLVARTTTPREGPIVVGVNGSSSSEQALDFAFETAARQQAELVVVRAVASGSSNGTGGDPLAALTDLVAARANKYHLDAQVRVLPGEPEAVLVAASTWAGSVIIGARGQRPCQGLGSAAQTLLHHSPAPIILVRGATPVVETLWSRTIGPAPAVPVRRHASDDAHRCATGVIGPAE